MQSKYKIGGTFNTGLTNQENLIVRRRGFLVTPGVSFRAFLHNIFSGFIISGGIAGIIFSLGVFLGFTFSFLLSGIFLTFALVTLLYSTLYYATSSKYFFINSGILTFGKLYNSIGDAKKTEEKIFIMKRFSEKVTRFFYKTKNTAEFIDLMKILGPVGMIIAGVIYLNKYFPAFTNFDILRNVFILVSPLISLVILAFIVRTSLEFLHPLYAFGNLGSKIQSLTLRISEESTKIEKEFSTDMNFRTLSDAFDTLASDFNQIIGYVIRLEIIEKKANKGNLFDSTKYINSLREDIRNPLIALRSFLQKKKTELEASKEEIKKVRVKVGGKGETDNLDLSSKRTEPLIQELTENIEKLDRMIEKF